jgi:hypothetical protein
MWRKNIEGIILRISDFKISILMFQSKHDRMLVELNTSCFTITVVLKLFLKI